MKSRFTTLLLVAAFAAAPAQAALNPAIVPADSRWVVHVDLNSLRASTLGKELVGIVEKFQADATQGTIGIDIEKLLATVGTVTAYGANFSKDPAAIDGTLVAQGTPDLRKIAEALLLQATITQPNNVSEVKDLPYPAYALRDRNQRTGASSAEVVIAFPPEPIVLVSKSRAHLLRARELFNGSGSSMAKAPNAPLGKLLGNAANAFLFGATVVPGDDVFTDDGPQARILKMATSGSIAIGEAGTPALPESFAHIELVATDNTNAEKLMKILQGMTAMLSMAETNERQLGEFLNASNVTRVDKSVVVSLSYSSARLVTMVQNIQRMQRPPQPRVAQAPRQMQITTGKVIAEWTAANPQGEAGAEGFYTHTVENVGLKTGSTISVGQDINGGNMARFIRVELAAANGQPLTFRSEFMRTAGPRGMMRQFEFPGADGIYTIKVVYANDPAGKARYALSFREPPPPPAALKSDSKSDPKVDVKAEKK